MCIYIFLSLTYIEYVCIIVYMCVYIHMCIWKKTKIQRKNRRILTNGRAIGSTDGLSCFMGMASL